MRFAQDDRRPELVVPSRSVVFGLLPRDVWPIAGTADQPAGSLFLICKLLGRDEIFGIPWVLFEYVQEFGLLLIGQQAERDRSNKMVTTLRPSKACSGGNDKKQNQNDSSRFSHEGNCTASSTSKHFENRTGSTPDASDLLFQFFLISLSRKCFLDGLDPAPEFPSDRKCIKSILKANVSVHHRFAFGFATL
jgi:hypothetical protein